MSAPGQMELALSRPSRTTRPGLKRDWPTMLPTGRRRRRSAATTPWSARRTPDTRAAGRPRSACAERAAAEPLPGGRGLRRTPLRQVAGRAIPSGPRLAVEAALEVQLIARLGDRID